MGHLFSRAFKRLTQCTSHQSSRNQAQQLVADSRQEEPVAAPASSVQQQDNSNEATETELIPVGKSIDDTGSVYVAAENGQDDQAKQELSDEPTNNNTTSETPKQDVEGAVIKIQALVRGHLTRKALKDAHQHHSLPTPNALGQSQFDEESLTSGPPSAIFSTASPLAMGAGFQAQVQQQQQRAANSDANNNGNKTPLESIAEALETSMTSGNTMAGPQLVEAPAKTNDDRRRLMKLCTRSATSPAAERLEPASSGVEGTSPVPSEANASIDLNTSRAPSCDTPASCSIDILDHNIKPTDKLASVLHHHHYQQQHQHSEDQNQQPNSQREAPEPSEGLNRQSAGSLEVGERTREWVEKGADVVSGPSVGEVSTSADLEEEEAAAIRIQSAFRGYRTRKNSPYRTRSPTLASATSSAAGQGGSHLDPQSGQQDELEVETRRAEEEPELRGPNPERRPSRPRQRDLDGYDDDDMLAQQLASQSTTSASAIDYGDEDSTEAPTVLETTTPALASGTESALGRQLVTTSSQLSGREVSLDLTEANVSELDSSQAVSVVDTSASMLPPLDNGRANSTSGYRRSQPKSEASTELDTTDSSMLGGPALSLDMVEAAATTATAAPTDLSTTQIGTTADEAARLVGDEDKSLGATDHSTAMMLADDEEVGEDEEEDGRRLVEDTDQGCALVEEAATASTEGANEGLGGEEVEDEDERELDQLLRAAAEEVGALNEEEQRAIELESDDIERRDPRGQASEERAKSPQIRTEPPQFAATSEVPNGSSDNNNVLTVDNGGGPSTSGRSSPVQNSSNGNSSEEEDDNDSDGDTKSPNQQQQQQQPGGKRAASRNKKRNNRNKRKGKK